MSFAARMKKVSDKLLTKFDERDVKIQLKVAGARTFNNITAEYEWGADTQYEMTGVAVGYDDNMIDGTTIQTGDIRLVVFCEVKPENENKVIIDGTEYSIVNISPAAYTGIDKVINYKIQIRK